RLQCPANCARLGSRPWLTSTGLQPMRSLQPSRRPSWRGFSTEPWNSSSTPSSSRYDQHVMLSMHHRSNLGPNISRALWERRQRHFTTRWHSLLKKRTNADWNFTPGLTRTARGRPLLNLRLRAITSPRLTLNTFAAMENHLARPRREGG